ncbi:hypothetical protein MHU86_7049 [Fragilaria crotonensis]|nr:hypothetical protein MHU86_7049 [Fragilaria crotonensis]
MLAFAASADPDTYYHEAMRSRIAPNSSRQWRRRSRVTPVPRSPVPPGTKILPAVWAMKRKCQIATREVFKWKARLNIDGSKQEKESPIGKPSHLWHHGQPSEWCSSQH